MLKKELQDLRVGSIVLNNKTNEKLSVLAVGERIALSNGKDYAQSTLIRNFNLIAVEPVQPTQDTKGLTTGQDNSNGADEGSEGHTSREKAKDLVNVINDSNILTLVKILQFCEGQGLFVKKNQDHIAIKYQGKRNIMEVYTSKKSIRLAVKHQCLNKDERWNLELHNEGKIVGAGTYVIDFRFKTEDYRIFEQVIANAIQYEVNKSQRKATA